MSIVTGEDGSLPRCKPFKYCYEKEIVMYAYFKQLDYFSTECIYSPYAYRGYAREFLKDLERCKTASIIGAVAAGIVSDVISCIVHCCPSHRHHSVCGTLPHIANNELAPTRQDAVEYFSCLLSLLLFVVAIVTAVLVVTVAFHNGCPHCCACCHCCCVAVVTTVVLTAVQVSVRDAAT